MEKNEAEALRALMHKIIGAFIQHQTVTTVQGMEEIKDLVGKVRQDSGLSDEDAKVFNDALLDLALIGFVTVESVKKGVDKILDPEPFTDKDASEVREKMKAPKSSNDGGLNFL